MLWELPFSRYNRSWSLEFQIKTVRASSSQRALLVLSALDNRASYSLFRWLKTRGMTAGEGPLVQAPGYYDAAGTTWLNC